jgi:hypothetical protein
VLQRHFDDEADEIRVHVDCMVEKTGIPDCPKSCHELVATKRGIDTEPCEASSATGVQEYWNRSRPRRQVARRIEEAGKKGSRKSQIDEKRAVRKNAQYEKTGSNGEP